MKSISSCSFIYHPDICQKVEFGKPVYAYDPKMSLGMHTSEQCEAGRKAVKEGRSSKERSLQGQTDMVHMLGWGREWGWRLGIETAADESNRSWCAACCCI